MQKYQCHKVVEATKITLVTSLSEDVEGKPQIIPHKAEVETDGGETFRVSYGEKMPQAGDYVVRYADGYVSWSPAQPFEEGYTPLAE